jgi:hypothetical protein
MSPRVHLMLADAAQAVNGKLYILGGGWSWIVAGMPFAVAFKLEIPYSRATEKHTWKLSLLDADGQPVLVQMKPDAEPEPLVVGDEFCTGIPPGIAPGTPLDYVYTWRFAPGASARVRSPRRVAVRVERRDGRGLVAWIHDGSSAARGRRVVREGSRGRSPSRPQPKRPSRNTHARRLLPPRRREDAGGALLLCRPRLPRPRPTRGEISHLGGCRL